MFLPSNLFWQKFKKKHKHVSNNVQFNKKVYKLLQPNYPFICLSVLKACPHPRPHTLYSLLSKLAPLFPVHSYSLPYFSVHILIWTPIPLSGRVPIKCETKQKRNETKRNEINENETKRNETKRNQRNGNEMKRNQRKKNEID